MKNRLSLLKGGFFIWFCYRGAIIQIFDSAHDCERRKSGAAPHARHFPAPLGKNVPKYFEKQVLFYMFAPRAIIATMKLYGFAYFFGFFFFNTKGNGIVCM